MSEQSTLPAGLTHGATRLPSVIVESYNVEVRDEDGFVGDRANKGAFRDLLAKWRDVMSQAGDDPFGDQDTDAIAKKHLEELLVAGDPEAASIVQSAIEEFAQELAAVIRRFLKLKAWRDTERLVVGGGFRGGRVGELAVGRAAILLKAEYPDFELTLIRNDPDHAGLMRGSSGAVVDFQGPPCDFGRRYRRHEHSRRRGGIRRQKRSDARKGFGLETRALAPRG
jgi:hypothetical protein